LSVLEEIRLLTNLETPQQKLLQIVLVGQPELDAKLDCYELRQLKQRIAIRCRLEPLRKDEVRAYIERRLQAAGANGYVQGLFPDETIAAVYQYSLGVPRVINSLCDQALLAAYARQQKVITVDVINEIAKYYRLQSPPNFTESENGHSNADRSKQATTKSLREMIEKMERVAAELARN
jgi:general secretion pathway protein A